VIFFRLNTKKKLKNHREDSVLEENCNPKTKLDNQFSENKNYTVQMPKTLKRTVSRDLRWVLLYINRKLFSRAIVAHRKILILLKGHFTIYKEDPASEQLVNSRWSAQF